MREAHHISGKSMMFKLSKEPHIEAKFLGERVKILTKDRIEGF